jgi:hypothetical protein
MEPLQGLCLAEMFNRKKKMTELSIHYPFASKVF